MSADAADRILEAVLGSPRLDPGWTTWRSRRDTLLTTVIDATRRAG